jgi:hypothetical protein
MDMDAFERLQAESRLHGPCPVLKRSDLGAKSRRFEGSMGRFLTGFLCAADALMRLEDAEGTDDDEERGGEEEELACPFCGEEFDGVGLCLHIDDEHHAETKAGVISSQTSWKDVLHT